MPLNKIRLITKKNIFLLTLLAINCECFSQEKVSYKNISKPSYSYLKFSAFPFFYALARNPDEIWLAVHYEWQPNKVRKFTINAVLDYHNWTFRMSANGVPVSIIPDNIQLYVRPQIRFYTGKIAFKGIHLGMFPLYLYESIPSSQTKGNYFGLGANFGYQFLIRRKIPLEFTFWIAEQTGMADQIDINGVPFRERKSFARASFEINFGLPIKR